MPDEPGYRYPPPTTPRAARAWSPPWSRSASHYELFPCDPALADTAAFCAAYGFAPGGLGEHDRRDRQERPAALCGVCRARAEPARRQPDRARPARHAEGVVRAGRVDARHHGHGDRRRDGVRPPRRAADLGRPSGHAAGAHRAWGWVAVLEGPGRAGRSCLPCRMSRSSKGSRPSRRTPPRSDATLPYRSPLVTQPDPNADPTPPRPPRASGPVQYKGEDLDAERGPGLGCFRFQLVLLAVFIVLTPLSAVWHWPDWVSALLLFSIGRAAARRRPDDRLPAPPRRCGPARPSAPAGEWHEDGRRAGGARPGTAIPAAATSHRPTLTGRRRRDGAAPIPP